VAASGFTDAVADLIASERADALVLDCTIYKMSESLFDSVRERPEYARLPIVVISDTPEIADESLRKRQATQVLLVPKPFTGSQVARALEQLLSD
jgi:CheY-like chemotaxis protein